MYGQHSVPEERNTAGPSVATVGARRFCGGERWIAIAGAAVLCALLGCTSPGQRVDAVARRLQFEPVQVLGEGFEHRAYVRPDVSTATAVHVYLEGDGLPWATRDRVSSDPTPRYPLTLHLAAQDPVPSLLLGRPCYYGVATTGPCRPWLWTSGRYSAEVVSSMVTALRRLLPMRPDLRITLVGYSGGGALSMLMAERLPRVERVVTIAANLDIDAWADGHGFSRLDGSLNPAERERLPLRVRRVHLVGELDAKVPADMVRNVAARDSGAEAWVLPGFDHRCCWVDQWPAILDSLGLHDQDSIPL